MSITKALVKVRQRCVVCALLQDVLRRGASYLHIREGSCSSLFQAEEELLPGDTGAD